MKKLSSILAAISLVFLLWLAASAADIGMSDPRKAPENSKFNAFVLLINAAEK